VHLTPHGKALVGPVLEVWRQMEERITQGKSEAEILLLRRLLLQIQSNLG
jgi:DNA-binding MarR family transcriptional regulator